MTIPEQAVIQAHTEKDAIRLLEFLCSKGYGWMGGPECTEWEDEREQTCYDIEPNHHIMHAGRYWYEDALSEYDSGKRSEDIAWIPEDRSWCFISVDDFINRCMNDDQAETDSDFCIDISCLM